MEEQNAEVLVIGAGPTGLFFAGELARHGVRARIIDKEPEPHTQTRATGIQPGALEVLHRAGVAGEILSSGVPVKGLRILDRRFREAFVMEGQPEGTQFADTCSIPQWQTEKILNDWLRGHGLTVERGVTAQGIELTDSGARVICSGQDGAGFAICTDYLIGAGGAHSPVRGAIHERLEGITYPRRYLVADVVSQGVHCGDGFLCVAVSPAGMLMLAELPGGRTLVVTDLPDGALPDKAPSLSDVEGALALHLDDPFPISDMRWSSMYHTHRRMAPRFSKGRCFLAGDAAHLCSPLGGEGMNSGFLDGASLAWMLGAVLRRGGRPSLLEAYEIERQEVARQVLASSEAKADFFYALVGMAASGRPISAPPEDPTRKVTSPTMLDLSIFESPLLGFHGTRIGPGDLRPGSRFPMRSRLRGCLHHLLIFGRVDEQQLAGFSRRWARCLSVEDGDAICSAESAGVSDRGAVLVRPDGHIGFQAMTLHDAGLQALDNFLESQFVPEEA